MKDLSVRRTRKDGPEAQIQDKIIAALRLRGWFVKATHGNAYQSGFPDLYACHSHYGPRWIEVKLPNMKGSKFTEEQLLTFPEMCKHGQGVWVLTGDDESEIKKLFQKYNWYLYLGIVP